MQLLSEGAAKLGIELDDEQRGRFERYYRLILEWNKRAGLTSVTAYDDVQTRHFLESLTVSPAIPDAVLSGAGELLDVGSGAGLPGLPLKIAHPGLKLTLLEATAKKAAFLEHAVEALGFEGVTVLTGRAEDIAHRPDLRERYAVVVSRAVARLATLAELCLPFCKLDGLMIAMKGRDVAAEIEEAGKAIEKLGGMLLDSMGAPGDERALVVVRKAHATPAQYPRRPGMPTKRPL